VSTDFENAVNRSLAEWKSQDASKSNGSVSIPEKNELLVPVLKYC
jgi:hypothetical protein